MATVATSSPLLSGKRSLFETLEGKSRKRAKMSALEPYLKIARWIARSQDPFANFYAVFFDGIKEDGDESGDDELGAEQETGVDQRKHEHHLKIYNAVVSAIPGFKLRIEEFMERPEDLDQLCKQMTSAIGSARSDDCGSLKEVGLSYAALATGVDNLVPSITPKSAKSATRGFHHPTLGRLLCPAKHLAEFDENSTEFLKKLEDGRVLVTAQDFPTFLYENLACDPADMEKGLCRGEILIRTYRHIYTSPSSAMKTTPGAGRTKSGQAKLNGLSAVTPRTIAYAALHTRWFLCIQDDWRLDDGLFNKEEFFNAIVQLFESDPSDQWCQATLAWWNSKIFAARSTDDASSSVKSTPSDLSILFSQRRARQALQDITHQQTVPTPSAVGPSTPDLTTGPSAYVGGGAMGGSEDLGTAIGTSSTTDGTASPVPEPATGTSSKATGAKRVKRRGRR